MLATVAALKLLQFLSFELPNVQNSPHFRRDL